MYTCGLTVYARGPHRQLPDLRLRSTSCAARCKYLLRLPGAAGDELHRRGRPHDRRRAEGRHAAARLHRSVHRGVPRGRAGARARGGRGECRARPTRPTCGRWPTWSRALEQNGHTYRSDGSIYFKIATLPDYGKLARLDHEGMKPGARVDSDNYAKEDARDFVLWKATKPGEPTWDCRSGRRAGPAGTSSARRWRCGCSASRRSTSTPAAST